MGFLTKALGMQTDNVTNSFDDSDQGRYKRALYDQMAGNGPSVADAMLKNSQNKIASTANSMAMGNRGVNAGLAMREAQLAAADGGQQAAGAAMAAKNQEQLNAMGQLGGMRGQDVQMAGINSGINQSNAAATQKLVGGLIGGAASAGMAVATGGASKAVGMSEGGVVPGKAQVPGDSPANDTVPAMVSPGEIVIPRTSAISPDRAKQFIDHIMSQKRGDSLPESKITPESYTAVLAAYRRLQNQVSTLERSLAKKKGK